MRDINLTEAYKENENLLKLVEEESGQKVSACYQCAKCTGGCPVQFAMDYPPNMIMRMLQAGLLEKVLKSATIWTCAACSTCTTRCPRGIDVAQVMDVLRIVARREGKAAKGKGNILFHNIFNKNIKTNGRLYELGLAVELNLRSGNIFKDAQFLPGMLFKSKVKFLPHKIKGINELKKIYDMNKKMGEGN